MRDLYLTYARRRAVFGAAHVRRCRAASSTRSRPTSSSREGAPPRSAAAARAAPAAPARPRRAIPSWAGVARPRRRAPTFRLGDDVVHAAFGEGVVTGVEPGGIVVVRFAGDGSERKLMAEYAPITQALTRSDRGRAWQRRSSTARRSPRSVRAEVAARGRGVHGASTGRAPGLATVLVGDDPGSRRLRRRQAEGVRRGRHRAASTTACPPTRRSDEVAALIERAQRRRRGQRHPLPAAGARPPRRRRR